MTMQILPATLDDTQRIYDLFEKAIRFQKQHNYIGWTVYDKSAINTDIATGRLYEVISGTDVIGIFTLYDADPLIWQEKEKADAVYFHRLILNQDFKGHKLFRIVLDWLMGYADAHQRRFIRMDTWAENEKLIRYYKGYGFTNVGHCITNDTDELPVQHRNLNLALLQMDMEVKRKDRTIFIVGAGAIGKALAVFLKLQGKNPVLIRGSVTNEPSYLQSIEVELGGNTALTAEILTATASDYASFHNLVVFTNKSYGNKVLAQQLKTKIGNTPIVLLQNGLTVEQPFIDNDYPAIYRCVLFTSSQFISSAKLKFKPAAPSRIGTIKGNDEELASIVAQLNNEHLQFKAETDIQPVIWTKAIANCVFNSVCPLLEMDNGIFHRSEKALEIAKRVIDECIIVARSVNVDLEREKVLDTLLHISKTSDGQKISTYQDILHGRPTEIDTLNLAVVDIARKMNRSASVKETNLLGELIAVKSKK